MNILGINYYFHDSTACVVVNGELIVAIEEERLSRVKHTYLFPEQAIAKCLAVAGLTVQEIDHIAVSIKPTHKWLSKCWYGLKNLPNCGPFIKHELINGIMKQRGFKRWLERTWRGHTPPKVHYVEHHLAHIAGSFYVSPFEEAALLSLDGAGEWATSYMGHGKGIDLKCFKQSFFPHSLGSFYEAVTEFCGFKPNYDEGKTMGLAPLGDPEEYYDRVRNLIWINDQGDIRVDLSYFSYQFWAYRRCSEKFYQVFGQPRAQGAEFESHHLNVAAAFQKVLEDCALKMCRILRDKTGADYLVIAGGVALNSVMNGRILRETPFKDLYVMPAAGDNGTALGAAYYVYHHALQNKRCYVHDNPYVGNSYSNDCIRDYLATCKLAFEYFEDIAMETAKLLREGNIIGWFQGRMEIGPRALGNRSILADPTIPGMKDKINAEVKHREAYRPFAPSTTVESKDRFFEIEVEAPFMLKVCQVKEAMQSVIPAITHVDGSARLQTVRQQTNPLYHDLITKFGELSDAPVVLNTSFNIMGEPVVESPYDAVRCFYSTGLDILVIGNFILRKR